MTPPNVSSRSPLARPIGLSRALRIASAVVVAATAFACESNPHRRTPPARPVTTAATRDAAPAETTDAVPAHATCETCNPYRTVGPDWAIDFRRTIATKLGQGDKEATLRVFRVRDGTCCPVREQRFPPGSGLWWTDPARGVIYLRRHDGRWAAWVTDGIWEVDVRTGGTNQVVFGIANEFPCAGDKNKFGFLVREPDAKGARREFHASPFRIVTMERTQGKALAQVVVSRERGLSRYHADADEPTQHEASRRFHWSKGCGKFIVEPPRSSKAK